MSFVRLAPEQHDTLDDVPEPAENPLLFGHAHETARLAEAYRSGKMHHALILSGPQGIGKATLAFHLAHHLLRYPDPARAPETLAPVDPASSLSRLIANGGHPAVLYLTRPLNEKTKSFRGAVTVDEIRRVQRFLSMTSHDGAWRIVIVDPADDMNANAANALLKNLEEPPSRTLFVLISHAAGGLLPTIRSRCQTASLKPLPPDAFRAALSGIGIGDDAISADMEARAGGSVREAILLTRHGGMEIAAAIERLAALPAFDVAAATKLADAVSAKDQSVPFALFNRGVLDHVGALAAERAMAGDLAAADRLASLRQDAARTIAETEAYNLDKRQHVYGLLRRMQQAAGHGGGVA